MGTGPSGADLTSGDREQAILDRRPALADHADRLRRLARTAWRRPLGSFGLGIAGSAVSLVDQVDGRSRGPRRVPEGGGLHDGTRSMDGSRSVEEGSRQGRGLKTQHDRQNGHDEEAGEKAQGGTTMTRKTEAAGE